MSSMVMMMLVMIVGGGGRWHIMSTVWQMRRMLHPYLMAMMMRYMTLRCLHQRWLYVSHELSHFSNWLKALV